MWIALCVSLVGVLYTIIFAGILLRIPEVASFEQRRNTANSGLGKKNIQGITYLGSMQKNACSRCMNTTGPFFAQFLGGNLRHIASKTLSLIQILEFFWKIP